MDIVERIRQLCARNDISIAALERQLNFGNGTIGRWSTASPTVERLGRWQTTSESVWITSPDGNSRKLWTISI